MTSFEDNRKKGPPTKEVDSCAQSSLAINALRESTLRALIKALRLPSRSRGLDVGCGIGFQCLLLAGAVGPFGHVTGLDISPEVLDYGRTIAKDAGLSEQISFQLGDAADLPFETDAFDWAWSADCVGYAPWDPLPLLREMMRVVKPGGIVALSAWTSENLLPGYPRLEARLRATSAGLAPFAHGKKPETHFLRALSWFHGLGLTQARAQVFADSAHAPLSREIRMALQSLFEMRWPEVEPELSPEDQAEFRRLCLPDSPDFILNLPDYFTFFSYTAFWGRVPG